MCGLAGVHRRTTRGIPRLDTLANNLLLAIESRGTDATGYIAVLDSGKVQLEKRTIPAARFINGRGALNKRARTVLLHTRYATRGARTNPANAHPVVAGTMAAVHNGTIYNADEVFRLFNLDRMAEVDSEIIPAIINHSGWDSAAAAFDLLEGGAATAVVNVDRPKEMILARLNRYPMVYAVTDDLVIFASTERAIQVAWRRTYRADLPVEVQELGDWEMLLVNGKVEHSKIRKVPKEITPLRKHQAAKKRPTFPRGTPVSKRARKRTKKAASLPRPASQTRLSVGELWARPGATEHDALELDREMRTLMDEGFTANEAYDLINCPPSWGTEVEREEAAAFHRYDDLY